MLRYGISRLVWLFTTVLMVSILSFFLSKGTPGDKAEALLSLQGLHPTEGNVDRYYQEYERVFLAEGLHLPWFYFGIIPSYKKFDFPIEWNLQERNLAVFLLNERFYDQLIMEWIQHFRLLDSICAQNGNRRCRQEMAFISVSKKMELINQRFSDIEIQLSTLEERNLYAKWIEAHNNLNASKAGWYYPVISWHGFKNQYHVWITSFFQNSMGTSIVDGRKVAEKIISSLKWTLMIVFISIMLSMLVGVPLGMLTAMKDGKLLDLAVTTILYALYATPIFWLATMLVVFFTTSEYGSWTNIFPAPFFRVRSGEGFWLSFSSNLYQIILPVLCLFLTNLAVIARLSKTALITEKNKPYVLALHAKGLNMNRIYWSHLIPNAMIPLITLVSNYIPGALAGSLIIEVIFNIPGMGRLMFDSLFYADWDIVFAIVLMISILTSVILLISDILYVWVNPKISMS